MNWRNIHIETPYVSNLTQTESPQSKQSQHRPSRYTPQRRQQSNINSNSNSVSRNYSHQKIKQIISSSFLADGSFIADGKMLEQIENILQISHQKQEKRSKSKERSNILQMMAQRPSSKSREKTVKTEQSQISRVRSVQQKIKNKSQQKIKINGNKAEIQSKKSKNQVFGETKLAKDIKNHENKGLTRNRRYIVTEDWIIQMKMHINQIITCVKSVCENVKKDVKNTKKQMHTYIEQINRQMSSKMSHMQKILKQLSNNPQIKQSNGSGTFKLLEPTILKKISSFNLSEQKVNQSDNKDQLGIQNRVKQCVKQGIKFEEEWEQIEGEMILQNQSRVQGSNQKEDKEYIPNRNNMQIVDNKALNKLEKTENKQIISPQTEEKKAFKSQPTSTIKLNPQSTPKNTNKSKQPSMNTLHGCPKQQVPVSSKLDVKLQQFVSLPTSSSHPQMSSTINNMNECIRKMRQMLHKYQ